MTEMECGPKARDSYVSPAGPVASGVTSGALGFGGIS